MHIPPPPVDEAFENVAGHLLELIFTLASVWVLSGTASDVSIDLFVSYVVCLHNCIVVMRFGTLFRSQMLVYTDSQAEPSAGHVAKSGHADAVHVYGEPRRRDT